MSLLLAVTCLPRRRFCNRRINRPVDRHKFTAPTFFPFPSAGVSRVRETRVDRILFLCAQIEIIVNYAICTKNGVVHACLQKDASVFSRTVLAKRGDRKFAWSSILFAKLRVECARPGVNGRRPYSRCTRAFFHLPPGRHQKYRENTSRSPNNEKPRLHSPPDYYGPIDRRSVL